VRLAAGLNANMEKAIPEFENRQSIDRIEEIRKRLREINDQIQEKRKKELVSREMDSLIYEAEILNGELVQLTIDNRKNDGR
jgi:hypothetical protein